MGMAYNMQRIKVQECTPFRLSSNRLPELMVPLDEVCGTQNPATNMLIESSSII